MGQLLETILTVPADEIPPVMRMAAIRELRDEVIRLREMVRKPGPMIAWVDELVVPRER